MTGWRRWRGRCGDRGAANDGARRCEVLRVLVGRHAHGLPGRASGRNERVVTLRPTRELPGLRLGTRVAPTERRAGHVGLAADEIGRRREWSLTATPTVFAVLPTDVVAR